MTVRLRSQQTIADYGDAIEEHKSWSENAIEDYMETKFDITTLINMINNGDFSPLSGTGSPEGFFTANYSKLYVDTNLNQLYFNDVIGADIGWVAL